MSPGPPPKPRHMRRHRAQPARGEWVELEPLERPVLPPLPRRGRGQGPWSARTRQLWEGYRADPATALFGASEIAQAVEIAYVHEELVRDPAKSSLAAEVRFREDRLGLSLKGKRDLRLRIVEPGEVIEWPPRKPLPPTRQRLGAVDSDGAA
jgi:hypothetical protein